MTIISALKTFMLTCPLLESGAQLGTDFLGPDRTAYSIVPGAGEIVEESYIDGGSSRVYAFAVQSLESTADELARIDAIGFYESLAAWFESQTVSGTLPSLGTGKTAYSIGATNWGYLYQEGDSGTGVYQIQCKLNYEQDKP